MNHSQQSNSYQLESLEQRVLLSADPLSFATGAVAPAAASDFTVVTQHDDFAAFASADIVANATNHNPFGGMTGSDLQSDTGGASESGDKVDAPSKVGLATAPTNDVSGLGVQVIGGDASVTSSEGQTDLIPQGAVILSAGPNAAARTGAAHTGDIAEEFQISKVDGKLLVTYLQGGAVIGSEYFENATGIYFDGGAGDDVLAVDASVDVPVWAHGGTGNDTLKIAASSDISVISAGALQLGAAQDVTHSSFENLSLSADNNAVTVNSRLDVAGLLSIKAETLRLLAGLKAQTISLDVVNALVVDQPTSGQNGLGQLITIEAQSLRIVHQQGVGSVANPVITQVDTLELVGSSDSGAYITELDGLTVGNVVTAGETDAGIVSQGGDVVITNLAGDLKVAAQIEANGGDISLTTDSIEISADVHSAGGELLLQPLSANQSIGVGDGMSGGFNLSGAELNHLVDGFGNGGNYSGITIGRVDGRHLIQAGNYAFQDSLTLRTPMLGGGIRVLGVLSAIGDARIHFIGSYSTTILSANVYTDGTDKLYTDSVRVAAGLDILISTGPLTGNIIIEGNLDGASVNDSVTESLTIVAGTGNVVIKGNIGSDVPLRDLTIISAGAVTINGSVNVSGSFKIVKATGLVDLGVPVTVGGPVGNFTVGTADINTLSSVIFEGAVTTNSVGAPSLKVSANAASGSITFKQAVTTAGELRVINTNTTLFKGNLNVTGLLNQLAGSGPTTFEGTATATSFSIITNDLSFNSSASVDGTGNMVFTADEISFRGGPNSVTSAGIDTSTIILRPSSSVIPIKLGISAGSNANTLDLSSDELLALNPRFKEVRIGWEGAGSSPFIGQVAALTAITAGGSSLTTATVQIQSPITDNDLIFTSRQTGTANNDVLVKIINDNSIVTDTATARYYATTKILEIKVKLNLTTAASVLTAVNTNTVNDATSTVYAVGTNPIIVSGAGTSSNGDYTTGAGTFVTEISDLTAGATNDVAASIILPISGAANDLSIIADNPGSTYNGVTFVLVNEDVANVVVDDTVSNLVIIRARLSAATNGVANTIAEIITAINNDATLPFTASVSGADTGSSGDMEIGQATVNNATLFFARSINHLGDIFVTDQVNFESLYGNIDAPGAAIVNTTDLVIKAAGAVRLNTSVSSLTAQSVAEGGIVITESNGITINGLSTVKGSISVFSSLGGLILSSSGTGLSAAGGNVVLQSADTLQQAANITNVTSAGSVYLNSTTADISMTAGSQTVTNNGNVRYAAKTNLAISVINAGTGNVSLVATTGAITDQNTTTLNITAAGLRIEALGNVGSGTDPLEISVDTLASLTGGSIFLSELNGVTIGSLTITVQYLNSNLSTTSVTDVSIAGLKTTAGGSVSLQVSSGSLTANQAIEVNTTGNIRLTALGSAQDIILTAPITSGSGHITLLADHAITHTAAADITTAGGTVDFEVGNGSITMADGTLISTPAGNIRLKASDSVAIGGLSVGTGSVSVIATTGSITDAGNVDLEIAAAVARLVAGTGVGASANALEIAVTTLAVSAGAGGIYLNEDDAITIDTVGPISVNRVASDATTSVGTQQTDAALSDLTATGAGNIVLRTTNGAITINDGSSPAGGNGVVTASGNILIQTLAVGGTDDDIVLNASVVSTSGSISLIANRSITQAAAANVQTGGSGTIEAQAQNGSITMADGSVTSTAGGNIRYQAALDFLIASLNAGAGNISIITGTGSVTDNGDAHKDIVAANLRIVAGVGAGSGANQLDISVGTVAAQGGSVGVFLLEDDAITIGSVGPITANRVDTDGTTPVGLRLSDSAINGISTSSNGRVVVTTVNGSLQVSQAVSANGTGNILLQTATSATNIRDITLDAAVSSGTGRISIIANRNVIQNAAGDISTTGGTIDVEAQNGSVTMADGAVSQTSAGSLRYKASTDVTIGGLNAGSGTVSVVATSGNIIDGGDTDKDVTAANLRLFAGTGIGSSSNTIDTAVTVVAAQVANGSIYLADDDAVTIGLVGIVTVFRVFTSGTTLNVQDTALSGETTQAGNGNIVQLSLAGTLTVSQTVVANGSGNILLSAAGLTSDVSLGGLVTTTSGNITVIAGRDVLQTAAGDVSTSTGTVDFEAQNGSINMADGATTTTTGGTIRYQAKLDVAIGGLNAASGLVAIKADRDVLDNGDTDKDIQAASLWVLAGNGIGATANALDISVTTIAAQAGAGGIFLIEDTDITVGTVTALQVQRVASSGTSSAYPVVADSNLSGLVTNTSGGHVILQTLNGALTVNQAVNASGTGNILLQSRTTALNDKDITISAAVMSGGGNISVIANRSVSQASAGDIQTSSTGTIDVEAQNGSITMTDSGSDSALATTVSGNIRYKASINILVGGINAGTGDVSLIATTGSVTDNGDTAVDIAGDEVRITAAIGVGSSSNHLDTAVNELAVRATSGGVFITDADAVAIDSVGVTAANRVQISGSTVAEQDSAVLNGTQTTSGNGIVVHRSAAGTVTVNQAIVAHGSGNILLEAVGAGSNLLLNASVSSTSGNISLLAGNNLTQAAAGNVTTGAATIDALAILGTITMTNGSLTQTSGGNIRYNAALNILVTGINAGTANVSLTANNGNITDNGDTNKDIRAGSLRLIAATGVGTTSNALDIDVTSVAGSTTSGGFYLTDDTAIIVDTVAAISVNRVNQDGTTPGGSVQTDTSLSGLAVSGSGNIVISTLNGTLTVNQSSTIGVAGNIRLASQTTASNDKDIAINALLSTASGNISIIANRNVTQSITGDLSAGGSGTIDVEAVNGSVTMTDNGFDTAMSSTGGGNIRYRASINITLGALNAGAGLISVVTSTGSVTDAGETALNITGAKLRVSAATGFGTGSNHIETAINILAARVTSNGIYLIEQDALTIDTVDIVSVNRVAADATTSAVTDTSINDVVVTAASANVVLITLNGTLTVNDGTVTDTFGITVGDFGNIRLESRTTATNDKDIALNAIVKSNSGKITLLANNSVLLAATGDVSTTSTVEIEATNGSITMSNGAVVQTTGAAIRLYAANNVVIGSLNAGTGDLSVTAVSGSITDGGDTDKDLVANRARLVAGNAVGASGNHLDTAITTLTARAGGGGVFLTDDDALTVDAVGSITVSRVDVDGLTPVGLRITDAAQTEIRTLSGNGSVVLITLNGALTLNQAIIADGDGNIRLETRTTALNDKDLVVNAAIQSGTGDITLLGNRDTTQSAVGDVSTVGGTVDATALNGSITMTNGALTQSGNGNIRYYAAQGVTVGGLNAGTASVSVTAANGSISDGGDLDKDLVASFARLSASAGIGSSANALETSIGTLAASSGTAGVYILEDDSLIVDTVSAVVVNRVDTDATTPVGLVQTDAALSDVVVLAGTGNLVLRTVNGSITMRDGTAAADGFAARVLGSGNILLESQTSAANDKDIILNSALSAVSGNISVVANRSIAQNATANITVGSTGTIDLEAKKGSITMVDGVRAVTAGGSIRYKADVDVTIGGLNASTGSVSVIATTGSVIDGGDTHLEVIANQLRLSAGVGVGTSINALDTQVTTVSARATTGGISLNETDALIIDDTSVSVVRVLASGSNSTLTDALQSDLATTSGNGSILLTAGGDLTINDGTADADNTGISANGSGTITITVSGAGKDLIVNADLKSGSGNVGIQSARNINFNSTADIRTGSTATINVQAVAGSITQADNSLFTTGSGNVTITAAVNFSTGGISTSGDVFITATTGSVLDSGDIYVDVVGNNLTLIAATGVPGIETTVATLVAHVTGTGNLVVAETDAIVLSDVDTANGFITITAGGQVTATDVVSLTDNDANDISITTTAGGIVAGIINAGTQGDINLTSFTTITDAAGKITGDVLTVLAGGSVYLDTTVAFLNAHVGGFVVVTETDDITITEVATTASANILIETLGGSITGACDVISAGGHVTVTASVGVTFTAAADIVTSGTGTVDVTATTGSILLSTTSNITTGSGDIRLQGNVDVTLGGLVSTTGNVSVSATTGSILDGDTDGSVDIASNGLRLVAGAGVGVLGGSVNAVETTVTTVSARAGSGGVNVRETDTLVVDDVSVSIQRVGTDAGTTTVTDATQSDVVTGSNGSVVIVVVTGGLTLNDGTAAADNTAVSANGTGNVLLNTLGGSITGNADVKSGTGNVTVTASVGVMFTAAADIVTSGTGTVDVTATTGSILLSTTSNVTTGSGNIRLVGNVDVTLGGLVSTTGNVSVSATTGSILDGDTDGSVDIASNGLRLVAGAGVGVLGGSVNAVETTVTTVSARAGSGGVNVRETDTLVVGDVSVSIQRVGTDAGTTTVTDATQSDVVTGSNGSVVIVVVTGGLTLNDGTAAADNTAVSANGTGNVLLNTLGGSITGNADVKSGTGNVTVTASVGVTFTAAADIVTSGTGTVDVTATTGSILLSTTSNVTTGSGNIRLVGNVDVTLGGLVSTTGNVSVIATTGSILDGDTDGSVDIASNGLRLVAGAGVGVLGGSVNAVETTVTTVSARAGSGGVNVRETDTLVVDDVSVSIQRVGTDAGTTTVTDATQSDVVTGSNGSVVIVVVTGGLTLNDGTAAADNTAVSANGTGNVLLNTLGGSITGNADVKSGTGNVTVTASVGVTFTAAADIVTSGTGTVDVTGTTGSILLSTTSNLTTGSGNIRLVGNVDVTLGGLVSTTGNVSVIATTGSILDGDTDGSVDIASNGLRLVAGAGVGVLGGSVNAVETTVTTVSARAGSGGVNVRETDTLVVGDVSVSVQRVGTDAGTTTVTDATQSDVVTGSNGSVVIVVVTGGLTLNDGTAAADNTAVSANGTGNVLLNTLGGSITGNADVKSGTGNVTVTASVGVTFTAAADIVTSGTGTVDVTATTGSILLSTTSNITTGSGDIRLQGNVDVTLGGLVSTTGNVSVSATTGSILDGDTDGSVDIASNGLRLVAGAGVGVLGGSVNAVETTVTTVSARAGSGGVNVRETDTLVVDDVSVSIQRVGTDAGTTTVTDATQSDVVTGSNGSVVIVVVTGGLTLNDGTAAADNTAVSANGTGNVLLNTLGGSITGNADVKSGTGNVTVTASVGVMFTAAADIVTSGTGTVDVTATTGSILLSTTSNVTTGSGNIRLVGNVDVTLGGLVSTTGNVSVIATTGSILDGDTDGSVDIASNGLRLVAGAGVGVLGGSVNAVETTVTTVSARAGSGGVNVRETDTLVVGDVSVSIQRVGTDAGTTTVTDATQSDVVTGSNGSVVIVVVTGGLTLNDGTAAADNTAVSANGTGNVLLNTLGGSITGNADVKSGTGNVTVTASVGVTFTAAADIVTSGTGTVDVTATTGSILLSTTSNVTTGSGNIRLVGNVDVTLGGLVSTTGNVSVIATTGSILDGDTDGSVDIASNGLRLVAGAGVGVLGGSVNAVETTVTTVSARAGSGGVNVRETDTLVVDDVSVSIQRVGTDAGTTTVTDATQSDVVTGSNGSVVIVVVTGGLTLNDGTAAADNTAVSANGTGNVLLNTLGGSITGNADVKSGTGNVTVTASVGVTFTAAADIVTSGTGTVDVTGTTGSITQADNSLFTTGSGNVTITAAVNFSTGGISTSGDVFITATTGSVLDSGDTYVDVVGNNLTLVAATGVPSIETTVATLVAHVTGSGVLVVNETDAIVLSDVDTANGSITVTAGGQVTATDVVSLTDNDANDISITTTAGGIVAGIINAGTQGYQPDELHDDHGCGGQDHGRCADSERGRSCNTGHDGGDAHRAPDSGR